MEEDAWLPMKGLGRRGRLAAHESLGRRGAWLRMGAGSRERGFVVKMFRKILKFAGILAGVLFLAVAGLLVFLSFTEYRPADVEDLEVEGNASAALQEGQELTIVSWNTGYGCLGETADFFMDGGKGVKTADAALARQNVDAMIGDLQEMAPDIVLLQEVDFGSDRSSNIQETALFAQAFPAMEAVFARNFQVAFLPYPIPPIGKVDSGIQTLSSFQMQGTQRIQLPIPFKWPIRMANLKRCLLLGRIPIEGSERELVIVNLHLEAYDNGEGKTMQANMLRSILEEAAAKGNYVIAGGDFNQSFGNVDTTMYPLQEGKWACGLLDIKEYAKGEWQFAMDNAQPSCRSLDQPYAGADRETFQYYLIDGFIVSENVKILSCETVNRDFVNSDHNPVKLMVQLGDIA